MSLATRNMIAEHRDAALFGSGRTTIGENDLSDIYSMVDTSIEMQEDMSSKIEAMQEDIKEMDGDIDKAEAAIRTAIKAVDANEMTAGVKAAVLQVLEKAKDAVAEVRKDHGLIEDHSERLAEIVSDSW
jgi:hypothetical protein